MAVDERPVAERVELHVDFPGEALAVERVPALRRGEPGLAEIARDAGLPPRVDFQRDHLVQILLIGPRVVGGHRRLLAVALPHRRQMQFLQMLLQLARRIRYHVPSSTALSAGMGPS